MGLGLWETQRPNQGMTEWERGDQGLGQVSMGFDPLQFFTAFEQLTFNR